ncbi:hypothetical protein D3C73_670980 [compost metagenome]
MQIILNGRSSSRRYFIYDKEDIGPGVDDIPLVGAHLLQSPIVVGILGFARVKVEQR